MDSEQPGLNINRQSTPVNVPAFTCIVYVAKEGGDSAETGVKVRVANLAGLSFTAATERDALSKVVPAFKECVSKHLAANESIPWIDPPLPMESHEQERLLPVHL